MAFIVERGVPSVVFAVLFFILLLGSLWCVKTWGRRSGFFKLAIFNLIRVGASICGVIVAAQDYSDVNAIIADSVLTQIGSFMIYYTLVGFYHVTAKYYNFWQGDTARLVYNFQRLTLYVLIALAIASGVEGSDYTSVSSLQTAQKLAQAYSIIFMTLLVINIVQWIAIWIGGDMGKDEFSICCSIALIFVLLKAIYLIASAFLISISLRNPFLNVGWYIGAGFVPDFLASLLCVIGGLIAPKIRRDAARTYVMERHLQEQGARYQMTGEPASEQSKYYTRERINYSR